MNLSWRHPDLVKHHWAFINYFPTGFEYRWMLGIWHFRLAWGKT